MKAVVYTEYGPPDVLYLQEVEKPTPKEDIDKRFPLEQAAEAHRYVESGLKKGHIVIAVGHDDKTDNLEHG